MKYPKQSPPPKEYNGWVNTNKMAQCKCCEREMELRMQYCFECVDAESVIFEGVNMWDQTIPREDGMTTSMSKLKYILKKFNVIKNK